MKKTFPELDKLARAIGQEMRAAREDRGWTQEQLADAVEVSRATVSNFETGVINPSLMTYLKLAAALGVRPSQLLENALVVFEQRYGENLQSAFQVTEGEPASRPHRPKTVVSKPKVGTIAKRKKT